MSLQSPEDMNCSIFIVVLLSLLLCYYSIGVFLIVLHLNFCHDVDIEEQLLSIMLRMSWYYLSWYYL